VVQESSTKFITKTNLAALDMVQVVPSHVALSLNRPSLDLAQGLK
jgi:hypothetical protein